MYRFIDEVLEDINKKKMSNINVHAWINVDVDDVLSEVSDQQLMDEAEDRGLLTKIENPSDNPLKDKIYAFIKNEVHTYDEIIRIENLLNIS